MIPYNECSVDFSIINACSCKCWFCAYTDHHQPVSKARRLTLEDIQRTFRATPPGEKLKAIMLTGIGESILNPECVEIAAFLKEQTNHLMLLSNGVLMTPEISGRLIAAGVDEIRVSIGGATPEAWVKFQGSCFGEKAAEIFQRVLNNIKGACENRDRINPQCIIGTNYILMEENKDEMLLYLQIMKDLGVSNVNIMPYDSSAVGDEQPPRRYLVERTARRIVQGLPLCRHIGNNMQVNMQEHPGELYCCCHSESPSNVLGNILEQPLYELLTGEKFKKLCGSMDGGKEEITQACLDCLYQNPHISFRYEEDGING